eukprot:TRINITY_DN8708_c0_g1_i1.p1 TRINITY_DN8708_c0_g1~~TRINITY_DN8708_c0_g1_i1.p1  ORF type:complete len:104 (-),score=5.52 TRINITY_DN8708_c0_g1_i1:107-418(-)
MTDLGGTDSLFSALVKLEDKYKAFNKLYENYAKPKPSQNPGVKIASKPQYKPDNHTNSIKIPDYISISFDNPCRSMKITEQEKKRNVWLRSKFRQLKRSNIGH